MEQATAVDVTIRPYRDESDVVEMVRVINAEMEADGIPNRETEGDNLAWVRNPSDSFTATRDVDFAEVDGQVVGATDRSWVDTTDGNREYRINGAVQPEWRRRGIGTALFERNVERTRELAATHETDRPKVLGSWS